MMTLKISNAYATNNEPISTVYSQVNIKSASPSAENNYTNNNVRSKNLLNNSDMLSLYTSQASASSSSASSSNSSMSLSPHHTSRMVLREKLNGIYSPLCQSRVVTRIDEHPQSNTIKDDNLINNKIKQLNIDNTFYCNNKNTPIVINENNLYSNDSAIFSLSNGANNDIRQISGEKFRTRRQTIHSKFPSKSIRNDIFNSSSDVTNPIEINAGSFDSHSHQNQSAGYQRRFSVPDKTLFNADYAILRKNFESQIEVVGSFSKSDVYAYRSFLESLKCYDLAPQHGVVIMLDAKLTLHKAVSILCLANGDRSALVCNAEKRNKNTGIFTITDCLHVIQLASTQTQSDKQQLNETIQNENLAEKNLQYFLDKIQQKTTLITASSNTTIWDLAKLFRLNRIHQIPVFEENITISDVNGVPTIQTSNEILTFISLKSIFIELLKLFDSKCQLKPNLGVLTLESTRLGIWENIATINENATIGQSIDILLKKKVSCLPVLCSQTQKYLGVITKNDILDAVSQQGSQNYVKLMDTLINKILQLDENKRMFVSPKTTIENVVRSIIYMNMNYTNRQQQCIFVGDIFSNQLCAVVSFADIMQFILNNAIIKNNFS